MRLSYRLLIFLALAALISLSCRLVTGLTEEATPRPTASYQYEYRKLVFQPDQLPEAQVGADYSQRVTVEQSHTPVGDFSLQEGQLPPGLELKQVEGVENTAEISGTPTEAGTYRFVIYVWCYGTQVSGDTGEKEYTIVVK